jgi:AcrR family transcriptional regulator
MSRLTRTESQAQTRTALMDAARTLFVQLGVNAASVDLIAERAGYSKGAFYSNFASKERILSALLADHMRSYVEGLRQLLDEADSFENLWERLRGYYRSKAADPTFEILSVEFQLLAIRNPDVRTNYLELCQEHVADLAGIMELACVRLDLQLLIPAADIVDVLAALAQGVVLQSQIGRPEGAMPIEDLMLIVSRQLIGCEHADKAAMPSTSP